VACRATDRGDQRRRPAGDLRPPAPTARPLAQTGRRARAANWSGWYSLGGAFRGNPVASWTGAGTIEVVVRGTDDQLYHIRQLAPNSGWSGWEWLGTCCIHSNPAVIWDSDGRLHVFATENNGRVWHKWQFTAGGSWSGWYPPGLLRQERSGSSPQLRRPTGDLHPRHQRPDVPPVGEHPRWQQLVGLGPV